MKVVIQSAVLFVLMIAGGTPVFAQGQASAKVTPAVQAFEHYELVRTALAADKLADAVPHAKALAQHVEAVGGADAKTAADALAGAKDIEEARKHFGELSTILVPIFQAEAIPGATAWTCPMKQKPWMQRGEKMANPYYGKAMLTCGTALPPKGK